MVVTLKISDFSELTRKEAQLAHEERVRIERECAESIDLIRQYRAEMNAIAQKYLNHHRMVFNNAFAQMDNAFLTDDIDKFIGGANQITVALGGLIQFSDMNEFNDFMDSEEDFNL